MAAELLERLVYSVDTEATARLIVSELRRNGLRQNCIWLAANEILELESPWERSFQRAADFATALGLSSGVEPPEAAAAAAFAEFSGRLDQELGAGRIVLAIDVAQEYRDAVERLVAMLSADARRIELLPRAWPASGPGANEPQLAPA